MPDVTVLIPTYNRPEGLARTLHALQQQSNRNFAVVVVDDCGERAARDAVTSEVRGALDVTILSTPRNGGPGAARNMGLRQARSEFIAFLDDDVEVSANWLEAHLAATRGGDHAVSIGPLHPPIGWSPTPWNAWEAATLAREYTAMSAGRYRHGWRQFFTGSAVLRREDVLAAGGFDERFKRAEDIELGLRLAKAGCEFVFAGEATAWHHSHRPFASWRTIAPAYARFDLILDRLYPELEWLAMIDREASYRRRVTRLARTLSRAPGMRALMTAAGAGIASGAHAAGLRHVSLHAVSLVYDIEYQTALRRARARQDDILADFGVARPIHPPSTAPQRYEPTVAINRDG